VLNCDNFLCASQKKEISFKAQAELTQCDILKTTEDWYKPYKEWWDKLGINYPKSNKDIEVVYVKSIQYYDNNELKSWRKTVPTPIHESITNECIQLNKSPGSLVEARSSYLFFSWIPKAILVDEKGTLKNSIVLEFSINDVRHKAEIDISYKQLTAQVSAK
jgi:hypothetical protein